LLTLKCDCGYVASDEIEDRLVGSAREHAWTCHRIDLNADLVLSLATRELPGRVLEGPCNPVAPC
jgi:hypothetical protein